MQFVADFGFSGRKAKGILQLYLCGQNVANFIDIIHIDAEFIINMRFRTFKTDVLIEGWIFRLFNGGSFVKRRNKDFIMKLIKLAGFIATKVDKKQLDRRLFGSRLSRIS